MKGLTIALAGIALGATLPTVAAAEMHTYGVDGAHSKAMFRVKHLGISSVTGQFNEWDATIQFDPENFEATSATASAAVASIDTDDEKRDNHLKSDDFFNAEKFPEITFASTGVSEVSDDSFKLHGDLTIRDVTKPVVFDVNIGGMATDPWGNNRVAFEAQTEINRQDFNVTWNKTLDAGGLLVGNNVRIILEIEAIQQKAEES